MSERRFDPTTGEWVTFASQRQDRTFQPPDEICPLCPQRPGGPPTEVGTETFDVMVFDNRFPSFRPDPPMPEVAGDDLLRVERSWGRCEVVVYSPSHEGSLAELGLVGARTLVDVWTDRYLILGAEPKVRYVLPFENRGAAVGVTLSHPHGQIYAYPEIPPRAALALAVAQSHLAATGRCVQCDVLETEERLGVRVVGEAAGWVAYVPFWARFPYELRLVPRRHRSSLADLDDSERDGLADLLVRVLSGYDRLFDFPLPYVMGFHQAPTDGGDWEAVSHLHVILAPPHRAPDKLKYLAGSELLGGAFVTDVAPESAAVTLRELTPAMTVAEQTAAALDVFRRNFEREPAVAWRCPGRVNLIGDHTDHQGGLALPFAIDRYVTVAAAARDDAIVRVQSADYPGEPVTVPVSRRPEPACWASYVLGAAWLLHERGLLRGGADVAVSSTLPVGAGLSSSAAVTCATVGALGDLAVAALTRSEVARLAQQVENDVVGAPVGLLDQTAVLFGIAGTALLIDFRDLARDPVPLPDAPWAFAVIDTRVPHVNGDGRYAARRQLLDEARGRIGVASLSDLQPADVASLRNELGVAYLGVRHVVTENDRVRRAVDALRREDVTGIGELMLRSHESLRDDLRVSCPELDLAVAVAMDAGATGARMTGGGFGGSAIVLASHDVVQQLEARLEQEFRFAGFARPSVLAVAAVDGARPAS